MFRVLLRRRVLALQENRPALQGRLSAFADVLIPDGCAFKIASALAGLWPGTGTPAEFKLHAVYSVRAGGLADLRASAGSVHDNVGFAPQSWVRDALYIWDLGYQDYDRFVEAVLSGAVPLQRLKDKANPVVLAWYDADGVHRLQPDAQGRPMRLKEATELGHLPTEGTLDLDVQIRDSRGRGVTARVVCAPPRRSGSLVPDDPAARRLHALRRRGDLPSALGSGAVLPRPEGGGAPRRGEALEEPGIVADGIAGLPRRGNSGAGAYRGAQRRAAPVVRRRGRAPVRAPTRGHADPHAPAPPRFPRSGLFPPLRARPDARRTRRPRTG